MTPTETLVAALAEADHEVECDGLPLDGCDMEGSFRLAAATRFAALTPEVRAMLLLGPAVAELEDVSLTYTFSRYHDHSVGIEVYDCGGAVIAHVEAPTPLAAVEAALKELRDE